MKCIFSDFRRAITGRWFLVAIFASALALWLSIGSETWYFFDMLQEGDTPDWASFLQSALSGQIGLLLLPALSALPCGAEALGEIRSGAFRSAIFRTGRKTYIAGQVLACYVSGLLVQLCAFAVLIGFLTIATVAAGGAFMPFAALLELAPPLLGRMLCGGGWALIGCTVALLSETASAAMIAPLCLCYALTMIATRFFPNAAMLNPVNWQHAPLLVLTVAACVLLLATGATLYWEVQKHV
ncbi:MAG: hypothetical protein RR975_04060 [Clostridia bacterium]